VKARLLNLAAALSLLLAVAIVALWVRSYARREGVGRFWNTSTERRSCQLQSSYSSLAFMVEDNPDIGPLIAPSYEYDDWTGADPPSSNSRWFPFPPVRFQHLVSYSLDIRYVAAAYWLLLPLTLVLPAVAVARHRRQRRCHRETNNLCPTCGYDLRSTPYRCPECGTSAPPTNRPIQT
jgi:hypothetical protein